MISMIELLRMGRESCEKSFRQNEHVISILYVHSADKQLYAFDFKDNSASKENAKKSFIVNFVHTLKMKGLFDGAALTAEAWFSIQQGTPDGKVRDYVRPVDDPKRKEMLIVGAWDRDGNKTLEAAEIIRKGKSVEIGTWATMPGQLDTWLDSVFVTPEKILST